MKKNCFISLIFFISIFASNITLAQDFSFKNYDWNENEITNLIPDKYKNEKEVILSRNTKIELLVKGKDVKQYYLLHEKKYINSDDAIEKNNKIYIPFNLNESVITNKVRVLLKSGKVIVLDNKDIKEEVDKEKSMKYHYFAVNGLEKGAVIEKLFIIEQTPDLDGKTIKMQDEFPIASLNFELLYPKHLVFKTKSYNGLPDPIIDTESSKEFSSIKIADKDIPLLYDDEKYSNWNIAIKMFRYKLDENLANGSKNLYNFKNFGNNLFARLNPVFDKKQLKAIEEFCATIPKSENLQEQIWNIENKIKKTILYDRYLEGKESISDVFKSKQANQSDILKLYLTVLKNFKIENKIVLTSNRYKLPFDKDFESFENLSELLLYFPKLKMYLTPTEVEYRIPLFPANLANNNGLFIYDKIFAGVSMGISEVNFIDIPTIDITHDVMDIVVDFTTDIQNPKITSTVSFGGYSALNFQPIKDFVSAEQYKTVLKDVAENYTVQTEYKSLTSENDGTDFIGKKPFILKVTFDGKDLIQKGGENFLFSVGQTIGKQMELYQENKRTLPIEIDYPHSYLRTIKLILPVGVSIKNLDKLKMDKKVVSNGTNVALFNSTYSQSANEITISNEEYYKIINYPLNKFEDYKAVINAAADFNKIVLLLGK